jgi:hypothetical protein
MKVFKTTFNEEQKAKDDKFLELTPLQRWAQASKVREMMRKPDINYSYAGLKVKMSKFSL